MKPFRLNPSFPLQCAKLRESYRKYMTRLFSELGLSAEVLKAIDKLGFEQAAPIQAEAIPLLLAGRDVVGQSQTGSGKTAAFAAPAVEMVKAELRAVQVLILCPTRELALQVAEEVHKLALFKRGIHALPIYGGQSYDRQFLGLKQGAQIVIGTPGRLMDHMRRATLRLDAVKLVVLDEADVMLDMGFREDIEFILQAVPASRQTVFFSATMPRAIQELIGRFSRNPQTIQIEQKAVTVPTVEQIYYEVDRRFKVELLTRLIDIHDYKLGIIFCNTKRMVDDLVDHLNGQGYGADRLHGDMTQAMRDRVMGKFRKSGLEFLVATDVAARGIDVENIEVVFNYDLPYDPEDYVHRIGRTGRAGRAGCAISFVAGRELFQIQHIERYTKTKIHRAKPPSLTEVAEARNAAILEKLRTTLKAGDFPRQDHLVERLLEEGFNSTDIVSAVLHHLAAGGIQPAKPATPSRRETPDRPFREPSAARPQYPARRERDRSAPRSDRAPRPEHPRRPFDRPSPATQRPFTPRPARSAEIPSSASRAAQSGRPAIPTSTKASIPPPSQPDPGRQDPAPTPPVPSSPPPTPATSLTAVPSTKNQPGPVLPSGPARPPKASRRTPEDQVRLYMNVGEQMGITPADVVQSISGETGLPAKVVGTVDIRERHLFVDVAAPHANAIISKLNRSRIKGNKVKVKTA